MRYDYRTQRSHIFTESGQIMFLKIRDNAKALIAKSGAAPCEKIIAECTGCSWDMMACVDRLVELGEILEIPNTLSGAGQHRIFTSFERGR